MDYHFGIIVPSNPLEIHNQITLIEQKNTSDLRVKIRFSENLETERGGLCVGDFSAK